MWRKEGRLLYYNGEMVGYTEKVGMERNIRGDWFTVEPGIIALHLPYLDQELRGENTVFYVGNGDLVVEPIFNKDNVEYEVARTYMYLHIDFEQQAIWVEYSDTKIGDVRYMLYDEIVMFKYGSIVTWGS